MWKKFTMDVKEIHNAEIKKKKRTSQFRSKL